MIVTRECTCGCGTELTYDTETLGLELADDYLSITINVDLVNLIGEILHELEELKCTTSQD